MASYDPYAKKSFAQEHLVLRAVSMRSASAVLLTERLSAELASRYEDEDSGALSPGDAEAQEGAFVIASLQTRPVGCGALRPLEPGVGEIKRMFVEPDVRGFGIGRQILAALEQIARALRYSTLRLETGDRQPEAIRLYESCGYRRIPCYGAYAAMPRSVCFEKWLGVETAPA